MDTAHALLAFALAAGVLTITPGLDTALILRTAAVEGPRRAAAAASGILLGCLVWAFAASVGLGALLAASQLAYDVLRYAGAAYLIWMGGKMLFGAVKPAPVGADAAAPQRTLSQSWFLRGLLTNLLNPKVGVFYVTFLPLFIPAGVNVMAFSLLLALIHVAESVVWFALLVGATRPLARWLKRGSVTRALDGVAGAVLLFFAGALLFQRAR